VRHGRPHTGRPLSSSSSLVSQHSAIDLFYVAIGSVTGFYTAMSQLSSLTISELERAVAIKKQIELLQKQLESLNGNPNTTIVPKRGRPRKTPVITLPIETPKRRKKRAVSAERKAKLSEAAKARWAKAKASGKSRL